VKPDDLDLSDPASLWEVLICLPAHALPTVMRELTAFGVTSLTEHATREGLTNHPVYQMVVAEGRRRILVN
jgi:hypothetical protein